MFSPFVFAGDRGDGGSLGPVRKVKVGRRRDRIAEARKTEDRENEGGREKETS